MKSNPLQTLQEYGYKLTPQRRLLLSILETSQDHLDAESLYRIAKQRDAHVSLATVYRNLAAFKKIGLVQEHNLGEDHAHFEKVTARPHFHFTCTRCGQVVELRSKKIVRLTRELCEAEDLTMESMHLFIQGVCASCQNANQPLSAQ